MNAVTAVSATAAAASWALTLYWFGMVQPMGLLWALPALLDFAWMGVALAVGVLSRGRFLPVLAVCALGILLGVGLTVVAAGESGMTYEASPVLLATAAVIAVAFAAGRLVRRRGFSHLLVWVTAGVFVVVRWLVFVPASVLLRGGDLESPLLAISQDPMILVPIALSVADMATTAGALVMLATWKLTPSGPERESATTEPVGE